MADPSSPPTDLMAALAGAFPAIPHHLQIDFANIFMAGVGGRLPLHTLAKPYGTNRILWIEGDFGISCAHLLPGRSTSLHCHRERREFFAVRRGRLHLTAGEEQKEIGVGGWGMSTPLVRHRLANAGPEDCEVVEIFSPPLLEDKLRLEDSYGRPLGAVGLLQ